VFEPASPGPSNGGKSRHAALRARDRGRNAAVGQGSPTLKKPLRFAYGLNVIHSLFLTRASDGVLVKTPTFYVWKMFVPHHSAGAKWAPNTLASEKISGNNTTFPVLSAGTSVDSSGHVNISLANVDLTKTRSIQITLNSSRAGYAVASAQLVTGAAKDTYNDFGKPEQVNIQDLPASNYSICQKGLDVTLPPKSVVMLVLNPQ
jgi:alpha-L-arabinofuranosidase